MTCHYFQIQSAIDQMVSATRHWRSVAAEVSIATDDSAGVVERAVRAFDEQRQAYARLEAALAARDCDDGLSSLEHLRIVAQADQLMALLLDARWLGQVRR